MVGLGLEFPISYFYPCSLISLLPDALVPISLAFWASVSSCGHSGGERREARVWGLFSLLAIQRACAHGCGPPTTAACQPSEAHCSAFKMPPAQEMAPRVRRPGELRICLMGCALAVAAG